MSKRQLFLVIFLVILSAATYLTLSWRVEGIGFPLDDAWIHQTYARNLIEHGQWSFVVDQPSAGSTAPLWSAVLTLGFLVKLAPFAMTFFLGAACLLALAILGFLAWRELIPIKANWAFALSIILAFEWHLVWAALSGMETLLHAAVITLILLLPILNWQRMFWIGAMIGLCVWVRPDAITLLGPILLIIILRERGDLSRLARQSGLLFFGFGIFFGAYLFFNWQVAGSLWPNTFYAKQSEYMILQEIPFLVRWFDQLSMPLIGVGSLLLPGAVYLLVHAVKQRRVAVIAGMIWWIAYAGLYAWRLPVTYQHGRYIIPTMPIYFIWGSVGTGMWLRFQDSQTWRRVLSRSLLAAVFVVLFLFWGIGGRRYAQDVAIIETEMVQTAIWLNDHTDQDALIAAHDIGALGYFTTHPLLDLAGLVTPDVIPFIRDEEQLEVYMTAEGVDYLMTFPDWYPYLSSLGHVVYQSQDVYSPRSGGENMIVIQLKNP